MFKEFSYLQKGGPETLKNFGDRALFLAWPDKDGILWLSRVANGLGFCG
jgi:hypothetical protein